MKNGAIRAVASGTALGFLWVLSAVPCHAGIAIISVIDNFNVSPQTVDLSGTTGSQPDTVAAPPMDVIGGERVVSLTVTANPLAATARIQIDSSDSDLFSLSLGPGVEGSASLVYDGVGGAGLGGVDLTSGGAAAFAFDVIFADAGFDIQISVRDADGMTATGTLSQGASIATPTVLTAAYNGFTNFGGTDFTRVDAITVDVIPSGPAFDLLLDGVTITVPEPSSLLLICGGAGGLFLFTRRRPV